MSVVSDVALPGPSPKATVGQTIKLTFDDCEPPRSDLCTVPAEVDGVMSNHKFGRADITSIFEEIQWGILDGKPACFVGFLVYFDAGERLINYAEYSLRIESGANPLVASVERPTLVHLRPQERDGQPTKVTYKSSKDFRPRVEALGNGGEIGGISAEHEYEKYFSWSLRGKPIARGGRQIGVRWKITEDGAQKTGIPHHIKFGVILRHCGQPFQISITSEGKTSAWDSTRLGFLRNNRDEEKEGPEVRTFEPESKGSERQLEVNLLDQYVLPKTVDKEEDQ